MENTLMNGEGNVGMAWQNPNERLHIHGTKTDADHRCEFGFTVLEINENTKVGMEFNPNQKLFISNEA
jgi:hypothetical protein